MTTDPMIEAVEAAARAMIRIRWPDSEPITPEDRRVAQAAIEAALPILRAQFAEEVATVFEVASEQYVTWTMTKAEANTRRSALLEAAAIARNWGAK